MKESNLKLAQRDIEEALKTVEEMEEFVDTIDAPKEVLKEKFYTLTQKVQQLEDILKKYEILANQKKITVNNYILDENVYIGKTALKIILSNLISNAVKYTDVNGVINIGIVNDWLYIENSYGNNKISNMDKIFDVKFDLNKENSNGLGLYIVSNILNNYNIEYKALQDEEFFIFKIKIFS